MIIIAIIIILDADCPVKIRIIILTDIVCHVAAAHKSSTCFFYKSGKLLLCLVEQDSFKRFALCLLCLFFVLFFVCLNEPNNEISKLLLNHEK